MRLSRSRAGRTVLAGCSVALVAVAAAFTGTDTVAGSATAAEFDIRGLDIGNYQTVPRQYYGFFNPTMRSGSSLAVARLAEHTINGIDIDPKLRHHRMVKAITAPNDVIRVLATGAADILARHGMKFGFGVGNADRASTKGQNGGFTAVGMMIMQFPDPSAAAAAAIEVEAADFAVAAGQNVPVALPKYPAAKAHWRPGIGTLGLNYAHGHYLVNMLVEYPSPDLPGMVALAERALDLQVGKLDALPPLTDREILHLDPGAGDMLGRTVYSSGQIYPDMPVDVPLGPNAVLHFSEDPVEQRGRLGEAGVDLIFNSEAGSTWRARDEAAATVLLERTAKLRGEHGTPIDPPKGLPGAKCFEGAGTGSGSPKFSCIVRYGRYVGAVAGAQRQDVYHRTSAQYVLFVRNR
ncbi:DUF7373 family lipoprotein [Nocardia cyriacigeorgica]|uniref:DUF7373 family lipoprotein n=1 Tax=Nocardia cyriacigeorgica TaxID=135487 RepID=UPI001894F381|nr:hypothetical protein [Nocardia cyriacigeorgica]MBF6416621.1 hypothetical protein [Nocardia cyriacigeorgica]